MRALLEQREAALRAQVERANERLTEFATTIREQGSTVTGSRGQVRPHPLLAAEREIRREQTRTHKQLEDVVRRLHTERQLEQANGLTAWKRRDQAASN
jgi:hypothetical protein